MVMKNIGSVKIQLLIKTSYTGNDVWLNIKLLFKRRKRYVKIII